jgi:hypothetical protein
MSTIEPAYFGASSAVCPAAFADEVTPSNEDFASGWYSRAIYVGGAGDLVVTMAGNRDKTVTFKDVPAGQVLPIRVAQVNAGTTATDIVAIY